MSLAAFTWGVYPYVFHQVCIWCRLSGRRLEHTAKGVQIARPASPLVRCGETLGRRQNLWKSFTSSSYLPPLLVRSSSCSVLFLFGAGACMFSWLKRLCTVFYVGLGFCRKLPYVSFWEAVPHNTVHISYTWMPERASFLNHCSKNNGMSGIWNQLRTSSKLYGTFRNSSFSL
jgi:hypothetical protein